MKAFSWSRATWPVQLLGVGTLLLAIAVVFLLRWLIPRVRSVPQQLHVHEATRKREAIGPAPKRIPQQAQHGERPLQLTSDGSGPLFHRRYWVDIVQPAKRAEAMMRDIQAHPNGFSPLEIAHFKKTKGLEGKMAVGDEYYIYILGPWDGPVRVIDVTPTSFSLVTLEEHLEAGEIWFRFIPHPTQPDTLRFEILSWARSRDPLVGFTYDTLKVAKAMQTRMWTHFCKRVVAESGGEAVGDVEVLTVEAPFREEVIANEP